MEMTEKPTLIVTPVAPAKAAAEDPIPFYGQTIPDLIEQMVNGGWHVDASTPTGVIFLVSIEGVMLAVWPVDVWNTREAIREETGIEIDPTDWIQVV